MIFNNFFKNHHDGFERRPQKKGKSFSFCFLSQGALCFYFALDPTFFVAGPDWRFPEPAKEDHRRRGMREDYKEGTSVGL